jgi:thiamine biosynthesis lipoprotein
MRWNKGFAALLCVLLASASTSMSSASASFVHKKKYLMGTVFDIVAYGEPLSRVSEAVDKAFEEMARLDDLMSDYKAESDLSRLNRMAHFRAQTVPPDLYRIIEESLQYSRLSDGKFDISVGPLAAQWKAAIRGAKPPTAGEQEELHKCVGYQNIELYPPNRVEFRSPCLQIDLGAIGKGYALDRAAEILHVNGVSNALLDAGGSSIYAMGKPPGRESWVLRLKDPSKKMDPQVNLSDSSVSTSEQTHPSALLQTSVGHIIDPEQGMPLHTGLAVSVVAKTATASDALSTTMLLVGPTKGKELVKKISAIAVVWISADGQSQSASSGPQVIFPKVRKTFQAGRP